MSDEHAPGEDQDISALSTVEEDAASSDSPAEPPAPPPPLRRGRDWPTIAFGALSTLILGPFVVLFLVVSIQRLGIPFELEWNEGQSAEQAWRFAQGMSLYPKPEDGWVPYMYAPMYHWVFGAMMKMTGEVSLVWGRLISWLSTLATMAAIVAIVRDRTLKWLPGIVAAMLYAAYYKATGFWFDIARNDAFAFGLGAWAMFLALKRRPRPWQVVASAALFVAATLAKQTVGPVAVACFAWLFLKRNKVAIRAAFVAALVTVNFVVLYQGMGNPTFVKYAVTNAQRHLSNWNVILPGGPNPRAFIDAVPPPVDRVELTKAYWRAARQHPPQIWEEGLRHLWLVVGAIELWFLVALLRRQSRRGGLYAVPATLLALGGLGGYAKYGGFINNFLPIYLGVCIVFGFAVHGLLRAFPGRWRWIPAIGLAVLLAAQVHQPWRVSTTNAGPVRWEVVRNIADPDRRAALELAFRIHDGESKGSVPLGARLTAALTPLTGTGLLWFPWQQLPSADSRDAHREFEAWLLERHEAGERVWVMHHQFYGIRTGHGIDYNVDMVRCALWAGDSVPPALVQRVRSGDYQWLVLDMPELQWEWIPAGVPEAIRERYHLVGTIQALQTRSNRALMPVTGADVRPQMLYQLKR